MNKMGRSWMLVVGFSGMVWAQGPLTPPGAPGATMKTLEQIEARIDLATVAGDSSFHHVISQPGSYYLSGNLAVTNTHGIAITATNVTLDLNGFTVSRSSGTGGHGIYSSDTGDQAVVRNGHLSGFWYGFFSSSGADNLCLLNLTASQCSVYGIYVTGSGMIVDCIATRNVASGIRAGYGSTLRGCIASYNAGTGLESHGIYASGSAVIGCSASYNSNTNSPSTSSQGVGIYASQSLVKDCTVQRNQGDGIFVYTDSLVTGNQCAQNGFNGDGAGIHVLNDDNRIENNTVLWNDRGIDVDYIGNILVRNTAAGNSINWTVIASNVCLVVRATQAGAISGDSGGTAPGSTDPTANFTY